MTKIAQQLAQVHDRINTALRLAGRPAGSVQLLAVSKTHPVTAIREAATAGQRAFGENYLQEALAKIAQLRDLPLSWHFIGPIQSNKTAAIAQHFDWVHCVDRLKIAQRLSEQRPLERGKLNVCLQVNISGEVSKAGVTPTALTELAMAVAQLPRLQLRGLMTIPAPAAERTVQRRAFALLRELYEGLNRAGLTLDTLSMGMTDDLEAAILEGATIVRVGTAIFGPRQ
jgi:PLP dependent protein